MPSVPPEPWRTAEWFTSPWNHAPELTSGFTFPAQLEVHDVTLRDGEQQAGVEFTSDDKVRIAEALAEAGVHRIEAGLPAVSPADADAVRRIASRGLPAKVYAFSRCMVDDVKVALDCGVQGVVMEIPSSRHLIELGYRWSIERAVDLSVEATSFAHDNGLLVSFFPIDATRASASASPRRRSPSAKPGRSGSRSRAMSASFDATIGLASTCRSSDCWRVSARSRRSSAARTASGASR